MALRVVARHGAGGMAAARWRTRSRSAPRRSYLEASTRLARTASAPPPPPPAPPAAGAEAPASWPRRRRGGAGGAVRRRAGRPARPAWAPPDMSEFAAQWMFGDQESRTSA